MATVNEDGPIIICTTDSGSCTCGTPVDTPAGMHHDDCPTNPASRLTDEQRAWLATRLGETDREWINRIRVGAGREPIVWEDEA